MPRPSILYAAVMPLLLAAIVAGGLNPAAAQERTPFDFFDRYCLRSGPDFAATTRLAEDGHWTALSRQVVEVLSPFADPAELSGWIVGNDDLPLQVIVISTETAGADRVEGCTVGLSSIDTTEFERAVTSRLGIEPQGLESDAERRYEKFLVSDGSGEKFVSLSLPRLASGRQQVVASVIAKRR